LPSPDPTLRIVILAGGIGSRFWPASTPSRPKQLLPLASDRPLIVDTVERGLDLVPRARLRILAGHHLLEPFKRALSQESEDLFWIEPRPRGTAPVLVWAAHRMAREDPDAVMVSLHSDHFIDPPQAFLDLIPRAAALARDHDLLLTIAVPPDRPETGYGYLRPGEPLDAPAGPRAWRVGAFVEKPDLETALQYMDQGYLWNSGIFIWTVRRFLEEVRLHAPEIGDLIPLLDQGRDEAFFREVSPVSVDEAVLERSGRVGTVEATFRWDDVGNWAALERMRQSDAAGNVLEGRAWAVDSRGNVVWSENGAVVLFGVEDLVVARSGRVTLVAHKDRAPSLKELIGRLPPELQAPEDSGE
jgi:mannose-1-phosphate guanylyltransferase